MTARRRQSRSCATVCRRARGSTRRATRRALSTVRLAVSSAIAAACRKVMSPAASASPTMNSRPHSCSARCSRLPAVCSGSRSAAPISAWAATFGQRRIAYRLGQHRRPGIRPDPHHQLLPDRRDPGRQAIPGDHQIDPAPIIQPSTSTASNAAEQLSRRRRDQRRGDDPISRQRLEHVFDTSTWGSLHRPKLLTQQHFSAPARQHGGRWRHARCPVETRLLTIADSRRGPGPSPPARPLSATSAPLGRHREPAARMSVALPAACSGRWRGAGECPGRV